MKAKKQLTLDYSKWRCGDNDINRLGEGKTLLLNDRGYMCCLGQFSLQFGCSKTEIKGVSFPYGLGKRIPLLTDHSGSHTEFSRKAVSINDNLETTPEEKISLLRKLLKGKGIRLVVKNKPKK